MLKAAIEKLVVQQDLTHQESLLAVEEILSDGNPHQAAAFLVLMRAKGETAEELSGVIEAMQKCMTSIELQCPVLDIVGTGGDGAHTVNISTGSSILAAACGVKVAKHGNRSVSSQCGSADVLEALGISIHQKADAVKRSIEEVGIGFLFAPDYHPVMQKIKEVRRGLNVRTLFNSIGPLLNPARPDYLMIGVADEKLLAQAAAILVKQQCKHALVFHGNGLDELTPIGPSTILEVSNGNILKFRLDPQELGFARCKLEDLKGGDAAFNAQLLIDVFEGKEGPIADTLILNAAVAVYLYGIAPSIAEAVAIVKQTVREKKAIERLEMWRKR